MILFCFNSQAQQLYMSDIALQLEVVENVDMGNTEQDEAAVTTAATLDHEVLE
jgi:cell fate (sporulation/competence/biofilm development) regulator YlbF (YheA/YmcA/DUF963 family)